MLRLWGTWQFRLDGETSSNMLNYKTLFTILAFSRTLEIFQR